MVIDTNILLHHFEGLRSFVEDVEQAQVAVVVVVPGTVIYEIDRYVVSIRGFMNFC